MRQVGWAVALGGWMLMACASQSSVTGAGSPFPTATSLVSTEWVLVDLGGAPVPEPSQKATLVFFEPGKVSGNGSCNRFTGAVEVGELGVMKVGPLASTKMACEPPLDDQERAYLAALQKAERLGLDGDLLVVYSQGLEKPLRFKRTK
jgi:heat shock protein HslJ